MTPPGGMPAPPAYEQRETLRAERSKLVSQRARVPGEPHRAINARITRARAAIVAHGRSAERAPRPCPAMSTTTTPLETAAADAFGPAELQAWRGLLRVHASLLKAL